MRKIWVKADPWNKDLVIAALESGADAVMVPKGMSSEVKKLGILTTVAPDGDLVPGNDVFAVEMRSSEDEKKILAIPHDKPVIIRTTDWTIIPLENLVAQRRNLFFEVQTREQALTASGILEKGVDGIIVSADNPAAVRSLITELKQQAETIPLVLAEVMRIMPLPMGDRVCVDTCTNMEQGQGMLIGNSSAGLFLVHAETCLLYTSPSPRDS